MKPIKKIAIDEGAFFEGSPAEFADNFFSNVEDSEVVTWWKDLEESSSLQIDFEDGSKLCLQK